ncbi:hypothetical protein B9Z55_026539 [Caenorhabditis nigoni]|uniref:Uncharacterized protein n=1 Tax=Caenorhabditis nigoni TaxID=1611254 RepID=A0A2G5T3Q6_9PELO|nr:hypothetical protein B9Z55_026539 [Caenorhabditis nigoni]
MHESLVVTVQIKLGASAYSSMKHPYCEKLPRTSVSNARRDCVAKENETMMTRLSACNFWTEVEAFQLSDGSCSDFGQKLPTDSSVTDNGRSLARI